MAIKKAKAPVKKGGSVRSTPSKVVVKSTYASKQIAKGKPAASKPAAGSKVKGVVSAVSKAADRLIGEYAGSSVSQVVSDFKTGSAVSSKSVKVSGRHRRKGVVPKTVRKWSSRITRRRKQEEKVIKKLFGNDGGKIIKKPKMSKYGSSGVITKAEALQALRS